MPVQTKATPKASISLRGLAKSYDGAIAVHGVDLEVRPGEFHTLLGPSGSGKTTLLNMIAGFVVPSSGDLLIDGMPVQSLPPYKRNIGMVFQHYALFPHMSVSANIAYPLRQRKVAKALRRSLVANALQAVGLGDLGQRMPQQLSGGQQQRIALARAMVYEPWVLLMDEPLGALDKKLRDALQLEIKRIHAELGTTFVYVTHDQDEALVLSDRITVMNDGRIEQTGSPIDLYENPQTIFVAQFIGESSLFNGTVITSRDLVKVRTADDVLCVEAGQVKVSAGQAVAVVVRPERLCLVPVTDPQPAGNALRGRILNEIYLGSARKFEIELTDGSRALSRETVRKGSVCRPGDEVWLTFQARDAAVLPIGDRS